MDRLDVAWICWILHGSVGCCMDRLDIAWIGLDVAWDLLDIAWIG